jgi:alpha-ketoglutarate-dependent taurine dioxygenase
MALGRGGDRHLELPWAAMGIEVLPLTACLGAEVRGVDMADVDADTFMALHEAFLRHKVLFFRDQHITPEQHIAFGRMWGELEIHPFAADDGVHPEILVIESTPEQSYSASQWHSDVTFRQEPALGSILRGRIIPPSAATPSGPTRAPPTRR